MCISEIKTVQAIHKHHRKTTAWQRNDHVHNLSGIRLKKGNICQEYEA